MSILSEARALELDFKTGAAKIEAWGEALYAKLPAPVHAVVDAEISIAKQGLSNAIDMANSAAGPIIDAEADTITSSFLNVVSGLGIVVGGPAGGAVAGAVGAQAAPYVLDAVDRARDALIAEIHVEALKLKGMLAGAAASPVVAPASAHA